MENVVNLTVSHVEAEVVQAERVSDAEGTYISVVEFLQRSGSAEVICPK